MSASISLQSLFTSSALSFSGILQKRKDDAVISSGNETLDAILCGGFSQGGITEILLSHTGHGEVQMLLPCLSKMSSVCWILDSRNQTLPYVAALEDAGLVLENQLFVSPATPQEAFWCAERAAVSGEVDAVVVWLNPLSRQDDFLAMRRLHLAASRQNVTVFAIRPITMACVNSPALVRMQILPGCRPTHSRIRILKKRTFLSVAQEVELSLFPGHDEEQNTHTASKERLPNLVVSPSLHPVAI